MIQKGKIIGKSKDMVKVEVIRNSACSADCETCGGCAHKSERIIVDISYKGACNVGDIVKLSVKSSWLLGLSYITYILPLVFMIAGYLLGAKISEGYGILFAFIGLFVPAPVLIILNKKTREGFDKNIKIVI